jgi:hypothetical protein
MLVPEMLAVAQLLVVTLESLPAEMIDEPGTVISGLIRPSSVGPQLLNPDMALAFVLRWVEPTEMALFAVDGVETEAAPGPELPAAKKIRKSLWFHMNSSTSWLPAE